MIKTEIDDLRDVLMDKNRLIRELDTVLFGELSPPHSLEELIPCVANLKAWAEQWAPNEEEKEDVLMRYPPLPE